MSVVALLIDLLGGLPGLLASVAAVAAVIWGALGRRKARKDGEKRERERITNKITEADHETAQDIQRALASHPADRSTARERLRRRLED